MCFVHDDDDVVPVRVRLVGHDIFVEFLYEREDVGFVLSEEALEVPAAGCPNIFVLTDDAATRVRPIYLIVEIVTVAQHKKREIAAELAVHLSAEEHHGIRLASPLCVPEDAELATAALTRHNRLNRTVHAQILLILSDDLDQPFAAVVE